jgi:hypothetical protein
MHGPALSLHLVPAVTYHRIFVLGNAFSGSLPPNNEFFMIFLGSFGDQIGAQSQPPNPHWS